MRSTFRILSALLLSAAQLCAQSPKAILSFPSLDSLLSYTASHSISLRSADLQRAYAKRAIKAAILAIPDPTGSSSFSFTNNTQLPVNLFPAEAFGGNRGEFREVQTGVQYNSLLNQNVDIKLLNLSGWEGLRQSKLNLQQTEVDNAISRRSLQQSIASLYFTLLNLREQIAAAEQNLEVADTLLQITENKLKEGLVRQQDLNDARVNRLNAADNLQQLRYNLCQHLASLKILCDLPAADSVVLTQVITDQPDQVRPAVIASDLSARSATLRSLMSRSSFRKERFDILPTISLFFSNSSQQFNTAPNLFDPNVRWIGSSYVGVRVSLPLPSAGSLSRQAKARHERQLAQLNAEHTRREGDLEAEKLEIASEKAFSQFVTTRDVYALRQDSYRKNSDLYGQGLLNLEQTLNSFNAMVNSRSSSITAVLNVHLAHANIRLYNANR